MRVITGTPPPAPGNTLPRKAKPSRTALRTAVLVLAALLCREAVAVDPIFSNTGFMNESRYQHTATLLPSGQVLVAGGTHLNDIIASAEIFDPTTGAWRLTHDLIRGRYRHTATVLASGKVLLTGGLTAGFAGDSGQRALQTRLP